MKVKSKNPEKIVKLSIIIIMILGTGIISFGLLSYFYFAQNIPSIEALKNYSPPIITKVFSDWGEVIGEFSIEKREVVSLSRLPDHLIQAFVAGEDARFFQHKGLDYVAIARAFIKNIFSGEIQQGGSTITQQVVKSLLLSPERSLARKIREAILAFKIERYLTKDEILFLYLNQIYLGHGSYGVSAAAQNYFGKQVEDVNLAEAAMLAGLVQAPSKSSPFVHPDQAKKRQLYILTRMAEEGFISSYDSMTALQTPVRIVGKPSSSQEKAPYFVEVVRKAVEEKYGKDALYKKGLQVYTTIDLEMQRVAQEALETGLDEIEKRHSSLLKRMTVEGALLCFDLETGYVKSMVGGRDFKKSQFNRAMQARRQTGSAFKPIIYAAALDHGYTPASVIVDSPIVFEWGGKKWKPRNFEDKFMGPITFRNALTRSVNTVTVKIAHDMGVDYIKEYARKLGITSPLQSDLSMALGSSSISLFEMAKAYAVFANQGFPFRPIFIKKILDRDGNLLEENLPLFYPRESAEEKPAVSPQTAYLMTSLMQSVVQEGTGWKAKALERPVAAKTGTTDDFLDAWFIGYTPEYVTGVWVGIDDEKSLGENETGSRAASPIWTAFMSKVLKGKPVRDFPIPEGIEFARIDPRTGRATSGQEGILECFKEESGKEETGAARAASTGAITTGDFFKLDFNLSSKTR
jgi:penicillin-binding protein 1A